ncbi:aspartyl beta-hydroxylase, partial [Pseudomonas aeruginosa]
SINQAYSVAIRGGNAIGAQVKRFKRAYPKAYRILRPVLAVILLVILYRWIFG